MRIKNIKKIRKLVEESTIYEECDWCKKEIIDDLECYNRNEFQCEWEVGEVYPEGRFTDKKRIDLCFDCREKFFELLEKNGIRINEIDGEDYYEQIIEV